MAKKYPSLVAEMDAFLEKWNVDEMQRLIRCVWPLFEFYECTEEDDWLVKYKGGDVEEATQIRLIATVFIVSRLADFFAGKFVATNCEFKNLWKRMDDLKIAGEE